MLRLLLSSTLLLTLAPQLSYGMEAETTQGVAKTKSIRAQDLFRDIVKGITQPCTDEQYISAIPKVYNILESKQISKYAYRADLSTMHSDVRDALFGNDGKAQFNAPGPADALRDLHKITRTALAGELQGQHDSILQEICNMDKYKHAGVTPEFLKALISNERGICKTSGKPLTQLYGCLLRGEADTFCTLRYCFQAVETNGPTLLEVLAAKVKYDPEGEKSNVFFTCHVASSLQEMKVTPETFLTMFLYVADDSAAYAVKNPSEYGALLTSYVSFCNDLERAKQSILSKHAALNVPVSAISMPLPLEEEPPVSVSMDVEQPLEGASELAKPAHVEGDEKESQRICTAYQQIQQRTGSFTIPDKNDAFLTIQRIADRIAEKAVHITCTDEDIQAEIDAEKISLQEALEISKNLRELPINNRTCYITQLQNRALSADCLLSMQGNPTNNLFETVSTSVKEAYKAVMEEDCKAQLTLLQQLLQPLKNTLKNSQTTLIELLAQDTRPITLKCALNENGKAIKVTICSLIQNLLEVEAEIYKEKQADILQNIPGDNTRLYFEARYAFVNKLERIAKK